MRDSGSSPVHIVKKNLYYLPVLHLLQQTCFVIYTVEQHNSSHKGNHSATYRHFYRSIWFVGENMPTTQPLSTPVLNKALDRYYKELDEYKGRADYELAVRTAFLNLLAETAHQVKWMLIPEQTIEGGIRPDGVLRDSFDLKRGFWEAKGPQSDPNNLDDEEYIVRLVGKVVTVSVETVRLVNELAQAVKMEDWMSETMEANEAIQSM